MSPPQDGVATQSMSFVHEVGLDCAAAVPAASKQASPAKSIHVERFESEVMCASSVEFGK
jgi:hypothetical protein